jgi:hypothetical protein
MSGIFPEAEDIISVVSTVYFPKNTVYLFLTVIHKSSTWANMQDFNA